MITDSELNQLREKLIESMKLLCSQLETSEASAYASRTPQEILTKVQREIAALETKGNLLDRGEFLYLFAPTGSLQEIAIDNGWGNEFMKISSTIEHCLGV